jgi:hypothetical protein
MQNCNKVETICTKAGKSSALFPLRKELDDPIYRMMEIVWRSLTRMVRDPARRKCRVF